MLLASRKLGKMYSSLPLLSSSLGFLVSSSSFIACQERTLSHKIGFFRGEGGFEMTSAYAAPTSGFKASSGGSLSYESRCCAGPCFWSLAQAL